METAALDDCYSDFTAAARTASITTGAVNGVLPGGYSLGMAIASP
jgi:hypothetical protein